MQPVSISRQDEWRRPALSRYTPAEERTPEMSAWIDRQLAAAPVRDEEWTRELYRTYGCEVQAQ
ncbi:hypothetical protein GCM10010244_06100 [Streptomyces coeruleorubidus]|nr:hypothetical protein GCM10010244_06100 [Streptomyces bellus]